MDSKTVQQLRTIARERGLKGYSRLKKADLIKFLHEHVKKRAPRGIVNFIDEETPPPSPPPLVDKAKQIENIKKKLRKLYKNNSREAITKRNRLQKELEKLKTEKPQQTHPVTKGSPVKKPSPPPVPTGNGSNR